MPLIAPPLFDFNGCDPAGKYQLLGVGDVRTLILRNEPLSCKLQMKHQGFVFAEFVDTDVRKEPGALSVGPKDKLVYLRGLRPGVTTLQIFTETTMLVEWTVRIVEPVERAIECFVLQGKAEYSYTEAQARSDVATASALLSNQAKVSLRLQGVQTLDKRGFGVGYNKEEGVPYFRFRQMLQQGRMHLHQSRNPSVFRTLFIVKKILGGDSAGYAELKGKYMLVAAQYPESIPVRIVHEFVHTHQVRHSQYDPASLPNQGALMMGAGSPAGMLQNTFLTRPDLEALHASG